jgi:hypothetical protein
MMLVGSIPVALPTSDRVAGLGGVRGGVRGGDRGVAVVVVRARRWHGHRPKGVVGTVAGTCAIVGCRNAGTVNPRLACTQPMMGYCKLVLCLLQ